MQYIDLTQTFTASMPVYPGDPPVELRRTENEGIVGHRLTTGMHVGTHMEAPLHMIPGGKFLSDYPVEKFFGRGVVIDARGRSLADETLLTGVEIKSGDMVLVCFGWGSKFRDSDYYINHPEFTEGFAARLAALGASVVGMDTPSPDRPPYHVHKILLGRDVLIVENLTRLEALVGKKDFAVTALPVKFQAEAAPCRVVAGFFA